MSSENIHTELKTMFCEKYYSLTEMDYYWNAKDGANLKQLITKLQFHIKAKKNNGTEKEAFEIVLQCITTLPQLKWHKENFSISNINSKLNEIISIIKTNGVKKDRIGNIRNLIESEIKRRSVGNNQ